MKKLFFVITLFALLTACSQDEPTLDAPENLSSDNLLLEWDRVEDADYYTVLIDGESEATVFKTEYSLHDLGEGTYSISVEANTDDGQSAESEPLSLDIAFDYPHPENLDLQGDALTWDGVGADSYIIEINGEIVDTVDTTSYSLDTLGEGTYTIRIKAVHEDGQSLFSKPYTYHDYADSLNSYSLYYNPDSDQSIQLILDKTADAPVLKKDNDFVSEDHYSLNGRTFIIEPEYLEALDETGHTFEIQTSEGVYELSLTVDESHPSHLLTNASIRFKEGEDIVVKTETYGFGIRSFSGSSNDNLTDSDYVIEDETLTIESDYFERLIDENPDREKAIMSIALSDGNDGTIVSYLFIDLN